MQKFEAGAAVHGFLGGLDAVHLSFDGARGPGHVQRGLDGVAVALEPGGETETRHYQVNGFSLECARLTQPTGCHLILSPTPPPLPGRCHQPHGAAPPRFQPQPADADLLLAGRGVAVTYGSVRRWCRKFRADFARRLRRRRPQLGYAWHPDGVFPRIDGALHHLWRAVDQHGAVLYILVQGRRHAAAAKRFLGACPPNRGASRNTPRGAAQLRRGPARGVAGRAPPDRPALEQQNGKLASAHPAALPSRVEQERAAPRAGASSLHLQAGPRLRRRARGAAVPRLGAELGDCRHRLLELDLHRRRRRPPTSPGARCAGRAPRPRPAADLGAHRLLRRLPLEARHRRPLSQGRSRMAA